MTDLDATDAHLFGVGISQTELHAATQRGLVAVAATLPDFLHQVARRAVQHGLQEALPPYWLRRAEQLEAVGTATADETAKACRRHAWILATTGVPAGLIDEFESVIA